VNAPYTKHTTHTDALDTLGSIIGDGEKRDAIHLAVFPVEAAHRLRPGEHVALDHDGRAIVMTPGQGIGIVDPFLVEYVPTGGRFWLVVYPRQITSLRHVWEHPDFPPSGETGSAQTAADRGASEAWLRDFLERHGDNPGFDAVIAVIRDGQWSAGGDDWDVSGRMSAWGPYIHFTGADAHGGDLTPEFWRHVEVYLGRTIPQSERAEGFSCSC
jgi:hypothetical protein